MMDCKPNADQQKVINNLDDNIVLFASAGTGKTFTVAKRVSYIIEAECAKPEEILCLTFTIKAANEMKDDILRYVGDKGNSVITRTIHSFAFQVLKEESMRNPTLYCLPNVCDETDAMEELKLCLQELDCPEDAAVFTSATALTAFSSLMKHQRELLQCYSDDETLDFDTVYRYLRQNKRGELTSTVTFYSYARKMEITDNSFLQLMDSKAGKFMYAYNNQLRQSNLLDFDDLICLCHKLFRNETARALWRKRFKYIIIDEMQDTSELEYDTLKQLFSGNHVMMCGDFFQTIYEWRGSNPEAVLNSYIQEFHAAKYMFADNYRSTRTLTSATFGYLRHLYPSLMGQYCPATINAKSTVDGDKILNVRTVDSFTEASWIYNYLEKNMPNDPTRICIMARSNAYIAKLYAELAHISIARSDGHELHFFTVDNDSKFFRKAVIKDILAFMGLLVNPTDNASLSRIARSYITGIGTQTIEKIRKNGDLGISLCTFIDPKLYHDGDPYAALMKASDEGNIVIYDTETTGLDLTKDQIIQLSAIRIDRSGQIIDQMDQMVIPTIEISAGAQATHHQTRSDIIRRGGITIDKALRNFTDFTKGAVLVGHNSLRFDAPLIRRQLQECSLPALDVLAEYDTMVIAKQLYPKFVNYKLATLCEHFDIVNEAAHDALGDIIATGKVLQVMLQQKIIPQTLQRTAFLAGLASKFKKFFSFMEILRDRFFAKDRIPEMIEYIVSACRMNARYPEQTNSLAISDLIYAFRQTNYADTESGIRSFLNDAALSGSQMDLLIQKLHKIPIITVHQSKGCEFDTVILSGADDSTFPSYMAVKHGNLEEEKRVFYVAITRAKRRLILTSTISRTSAAGFRRDVNQSRFIEKIPAEFVETKLIK